MPKKCKLSRNDMLMVLKIFRYTKCMRAHHHFRGSICIEKWSQNFDSGTQIQIQYENSQKQPKWPILWGVTIYGINGPPKTLLGTIFGPGKIILAILHFLVNIAPFNWWGDIFGKSTVLGNVPKFFFLTASLTKNSQVPNFESNSSLQ